MKSPISKAGLLLSVLLSAGGCAMMQPPPAPDPMPAKVAELERRLAAIERILASGSLVELAVQVDELQRQSAELRGRTETLEHNTGTTTGRQRELYVDLDNRLRALEEGLQAPPVVEPSAPPPEDLLPVQGGTDRENYEAAFELLKEQQYAAAGAAFRQFLSAFPDSQLVDNAQYWLAETYYVTGQFEEALKEFETVLSRYPRSRKLPDALLKVGYSNYELQRWDAARRALQRVRGEFPETTAAQLANQRLTRMTDEGH